MNITYFLDRMDHIQNPFIYRVCSICPTEGITHEDLIVTQDDFDTVRKDYGNKFIYVNRLVYDVGGKEEYLDEHRLSKYIESMLSHYIFSPESTIEEYREAFRLNPNAITSALMYRMKIEKLTLNQVLNQYLRQELINTSWVAMP
jgi:hypothetical protein